MCELKPEDVIRALELCKSCRYRLPCDGCPYFRAELGDDESCTNRMAQDALALLREYRAEIKRLRAENKLYENTCGKLIVRDNGEVVGFIEGQEKTYINKEIARVLRSMAVNTARTDAITEFIEIAKARLPIISPSVFYQIAKELKGEQE